MARRLVVTLPPGAPAAAAVAFAQSARVRGAALLELRTDLHGQGGVDVEALAQHIGVLVAERGTPIPPEWLKVAQVVDRESVGPSGAATSLVSHHAVRPLTPEQAVQWWRRARVPAGTLVKHVEPVGPLTSASRLLDTQRRLIRELGAGRVTVLAMGTTALPARCALSPMNELEYVASGPEWSAAPGQRLLEDAVREARAGGSSPRLGILGTGISSSRSPRIHRQPFDRLDMPADVDLKDLLDGLRTLYVGLAVTSPFKQLVARHLKASLPAVNTLVRRMDGWDATNTDIDGAREVLRTLRCSSVTVLGGGGASAAVLLAAAGLGIEAHVMRHREVDTAPIRGPAVWTWPAHVVLPANLRFAGGPVAVIAYGAPGRQIAQEISARGGAPIRLGPRWLVAQARGQRDLWRSAGA